VDDLQRGDDELEASGEAAEVVSVDHFPAAETSPEFTNESIGTVVWLEREEYGEVAGACRRRQHRRGVAAAREERAAAVRIQAFYRGYLVRTHYSCTKIQIVSKHNRRLGTMRLLMSTL
jgi:hypothetical protein